MVLRTRKDAGSSLRRFGARHPQYVAARVRRSECSHPDRNTHSIGNAELIRLIRQHSSIRVEPLPARFCWFSGGCYWRTVDPEDGATSFGYELANVWPPHRRDAPGLVRSFSTEDQADWCDLAGVSTEVVASAAAQKDRRKRLCRVPFERRCC